MDSKERVKKAMHFEKPDRIPLSCVNLKTDFFPFSTYPPKSFQPKEFPPHVQGGVNSMSKFYFRLLIYRWKRKFRKNLRFQKKWWKYPHESIDEWGIIWKSSGTESDDITRGHPYKGPLQENWDNLEDYEIPDASDPERYRIVRSKFWQFLGRKKYCIGELSPNGFFNLCSQLRGFSNFLIDIGRKPNNVEELVEKVKPFYMTKIEKYKEYYPKMDAIIVADDLGAQNSPFISPKLFKRFFSPAYKEIIELTHDLDMDFILHSCGQILELLPELITLGVDVFEFDSPHMTGVENFKKFSEQRRVAFWLSSNIQSTYVNGTPEEIEEEIKYYIKEIGAKDGGLAIYEYTSNNALGTPKENIIAQREAVNKWGIYNKEGKIKWIN